MANRKCHQHVFSNIDIHSNMNVIFFSYLPIIILTVFLLSLNIFTEKYQFDKETWGTQVFHVKNCRCLTESFPPATDCWWLDLWSADITAMRNLSQDIQTNVGSVWSGLAWSVVSKQQLLQSLTCFFLSNLFLSQLSSNNTIESDCIPSGPAVSIIIWSDDWRSKGVFFTHNS